MAESEASSFLRGLAEGLGQSLSRIQRGQQIGLQQQQVGQQGQRLELQQQLQQLREQQFQQQLRQQAQQQAAFNQIMQNMNLQGTGQTSVPGVGPDNLTLPDVQLNTPNVIQSFDQQQQQNQNISQQFGVPPQFAPILNNIINGPVEARDAESIQTEDVPDVGKQQQPSPEQQQPLAGPVQDTSAFFNLPPGDVDRTGQLGGQQQPGVQQPQQETPTTGVQPQVQPTTKQKVDVPTSTGSTIPVLSNDAYQQEAEKFITKQRTEAPVPRSKAQFNILADILERELGRPRDEFTQSVSVGPEGQKAKISKKAQFIDEKQAAQTLINVSRQIHRTQGKQTPVGPDLWKSLGDRRIRTIEPMKQFFTEEFNALKNSRTQELVRDIRSGQVFDRFGNQIKLDKKQAEQQAIADTAAMFMDGNGRMFIPDDQQGEITKTPLFDSLPGEWKFFQLSNGGTNITPESLEAAKQSRKEYELAISRGRGREAAEIAQLFKFGDGKGHIMLNMTTGLPVPISQLEGLSPDQIKELKLKNKWQTFNVNTTIGQRIDENVGRVFKLQSLNQDVTRVSKIARDIGSERLKAVIGTAGGINNFFIRMRNTMEGMIAAAGGEKTAHDLAQFFSENKEDLIRQAGNIKPGQALEPDIQRLFTGLFHLTIKAAESQGQTGRALGERDLDFFSRMTGLTASGPQGLQAALDELANISINQKDNLIEQNRAIASGRLPDFGRPVNIMGEGQGQQQQAPQSNIQQEADQLIEGIQ